LESKIRNDELHDESDYLNFGFETPSSATSFSLHEFRPSSMASYPEWYKFTSVELGASPTRKIYQRVTYDLLNAFGDVGGVNEFFRLFLTIFISGVSLITQQSLVAKYLYRYSGDKNKQMK
jgi:hypothetical protein